MHTGTIITTAESPATALITIIPLSGTLCPGWEICGPLLVTVTSDSDGSILVENNQFYVYGIGSHYSEAVADFGVSLVDQYQFLTEDAKEGNMPAMKLLARLSQIIKPEAGCRSRMTGFSEFSQVSSSSSEYQENPAISITNYA